MIWLKGKTSLGKLLYIESWVKDFLTILPSREEKPSYVETALTLLELCLIASFTNQQEEREFHTNSDNSLMVEQRTGKRTRGSWRCCFFLWYNLGKLVRMQLQSLCPAALSDIAECLRGSRPGEFIRSLCIRHWWLLLLHHLAVVQRINLLLCCTTKGTSM